MKKQQPGNKLQYLTDQLPFSITTEQQNKLFDYIQNLQKWNKAFNLTAIKTVEKMLSHHLLDSLAVAPFLKGEKIADVGSGAGLPGIPLAIIYPQKQFLLIDSNGKKTRFLQQITHQLALNNVKIESQRVENLREKQDTVISRAFASLDDMVKGSINLLHNNGFFQAMKGKRPERELQQLPQSVELISIEKIVVPGLDAERHLINLKRKSL
ncbi:MAG TPA: 16S rRNA (guanine(527)-N(7))-methyltransferase RsmG [Aeromonadales bacterium]|nr:16S rRNA (guanine(527)-N(7))-methyltransferase RsmG [Aeromonadales bacterium]